MMFPATWRRLAVGLVFATILFGMGLCALHAASHAASASASAPSLSTKVEAPAFLVLSQAEAGDPGKLVIGVPPNTDAAALNALLARHGGFVERWLPRLGLALVNLPAGDEAAMVATLAAEPAVDFVSRHQRLAHIADTPLDEYWSQQWGPVQVAAPAAWDLTAAVPGVVIAIIDTGVHMEHVDLRDRQWINPGESGIDSATGERTCDAPIAYNGEDDDANGYVDDCHGYDFAERDNNPTDRNGHGTVVAGIAAAAVNNPDSANPGGYEGIAGMGRSARFMALRSLGADGRGYALDIAEAIDYAAASGAQVVNLSLTFPPSTSPSAPDVLILQRAVEAAQTAGVLLVAAAGNESYNGIDYPARFPGVLAVGASTRQDARATFSNYGSRLDLLAPGEGIYSTLLYSGVRSYGYFKSTGSGTSFAAPHVAGAAALVRAMRPDLAQSAIYELIRRTADDVGDPGFDNQTGWGRLNAQRAVSEAISGLQLGLVADPPTLALGSTGMIRLAITSQSGANAGLGARLILSSSVGSITPTIVSANSAGEATAPFIADLFPGTAHITATLGGLTATLPVTITSGQPATLTLVTQPKLVASNGGRAVVTATVRDEGGSIVLDGTQVAFSATLGSIAPGMAPTASGQAAAIFTAGALSGIGVIQAEAGGYTATVPISIVGPGEPYTVTLTAEPSQIRLDDTPAVITATVADALGLPVPDGVAVTFASDLGGLAWAEALTAGGRAITHLSPGMAVGTAHITAQAGVAIGHMDVPILPGLASTVTLTADPAELVAGYNQITHLDAMASDRYGNPVADGTELQLTTTLGQLTSLSAFTTGGAARVAMLGGQVAGTAIVTVKAPGGAQASTQVRIRPGRPAVLALETIPDQIAVGGEVAIVRATVGDPYGNPVADRTPVTFTTNLGTLRSVTDTHAITGTMFVADTVNGVADAALVSGQAIGTAEVGVIVNSDVTQFRSVRIVSSPAARLTLGVSPEQMRTGGRVELSAWVVDRYENNVADGAIVSFAVDGGRLDQISVPTQNGVALTWLTLPGQPGKVQVAALSGAAADFTTVKVLGVTFLPMIVR